PELPGQLVVITSSLKKRKVTRNSARDRDSERSPSPQTTPAESVIPSCESNDDDDQASFSFSVASNSSFSTVLPQDSISSLPPHLQTRHSSLVSAEYASSTASSPCAAYAELSLDGEPSSATTETGTGLHPASARSRSPIRYTHRAIMSGNGDSIRSSSPLKRRASSMDPEPNESTGQSASEFPRAMSVDAPDSGPGYAQNPDATPPLPEQLKTIQTLQRAFNETPVQENDVAFVTTKTWVNKALALGGDPKHAKEATPDETLGPVDNSDIIQEVLEQPSGEHFVRLKPGTDLESSELFSEDAWNLIQKWYGLKDGQYPIRRVALNTQADPTSPPNIIYELHPPVFTIHRLWSDVSGINIPQSVKASNPPPIIMVRSAGYPYQQFIKDIKDVLGIPHERKIRLWEVDRTIPEVSAQLTPSASALTPPTTPPESANSNPQDSWSSLLLDVPSWSQVERNRRAKIEGEDQTGNPKYNGKSTLNIYNLVTDKTIVVEESAEGGGWVSTKIAKANGKSRPANISTQSRASSGRNSPALGPVTRGRAQKKKGWRGTGAVGLGNLGNTCYMNSALQCVRSVEELTKYFLTDEYVEEINTDNPLAFKGKMALAYGNLLKEMYHCNDYLRPSSFKSVAGQCRPTFASWGQQDSQEFLGFLLDALQEDLSRVKRKPYIEKPDSTDDMINDQAAIAKMADEVWDITKRRDDSVIADLFTGLYKSTLKCPVCHKISITFDPFNNLTLPLPVENLWSKAVKFYPLNDAPVYLEVDIPQHSSIETMKQFVSERTGVPIERLIGAEEFKGKFFKMYDDSMDVSEEIQGSDHPTVHELERPASNWPPRPVSMENRRRSRKLDGDSPESEDDTWDDPRCDQMAVPIIHRRETRFNRTSYKKDDNVPPHFIVLTREEARSEDAIRRKILEKVATFSTWSVLHDDGGETSENTDAEMALTSDGDSGDSKIIAKSVEGEEDIVDITMKDATNAPSKASKTPAVTILKRFNSQRPRWVEPEQFLDPRLQNLFEMSYFSDGRNSDGVMATGWNAVEDNKTYPKLSTRLPEPDTPVDDDTQSTGEWTNGNASDNESGSEESSVNAPTQTRMAEESSEDEVTVSFKNPKRMAGGAKAKHKVGRGRPGKHKKTYSKKDRRAVKARRGKHSSNGYQMPDIPPQPQIPSLIDDGSLVHLGEGIVVDWSEEAWDMVFGQETSEYGDKRGAKRFTDPEQLKDVGLEMKRKARVSRRSNGITLDDCLDEFERAEVLSEQDMWYCPRCKEHRRASKKFDLWKTPDILVCHLKRFSSSHYRRDKIDIKVAFPVEGLDLETRVLHKEDGKVEVYDLIGVDEHYGGLGGGHYTASAKNFLDGAWYHYNDSSVSKVKDPSQVVTSAAYLLFYRRRSSVPLGGPRFAEIEARFSGRFDEDSDEAGSGDEPRVGVSSQYGSSTGGKGTESGTTHLRGANRGGSEPMDELPSYTSLHPSMEDEGVEMGESSNTAAAGAYSTGWSFGQLNGAIASSEDPGKISLVDYASDDAQLDSASEGPDTLMDSDHALPDAPGAYFEPIAQSEELPDYEYTEAAPAVISEGGATQISWDGVRGTAGWSRAQDQDSDTVAEIRLEDETKE
ncbi:hypothetical protein jhhlp_000288, partial [Lomentospora prolificans]